MELGKRFSPLVRLLVVAALIAVFVGACQLGVVPGGGEDDQTTLRLVVDSTSGARLIEVTEYPVTSLQIQVTGPNGEVIQTIL